MSQFTRQRAISLITAMVVIVSSLWLLSSIFVWKRLTPLLSDVVNSRMDSSIRFRTNLSSCSGT